jgi:hypothetical protein
MVISYNKSNGPWTAQEQDLLRAMISNGENAASIARRLNRTTRAVRRRAEVLKLSWKAGRARAVQPSRAKRPPFVPWRADEELFIEHLFKAGHTEQDISRQVGRTSIAIRTRLYKLGLKTKSPRGDAVVSHIDFGMVSHPPT